MISSGIASMVTNPVAVVTTVATTGIAASLCCDKTIALTFASVIAAVAGVAYSVFKESMLGTVGFILLGVVTLAFALLNNSKLEHITDQLAAEADETAEEMTRLTSNMDAQLLQLDQNRETMNTQLRELEADNVERHEIQVLLDRDQTELQTELENLRTTKLNLEQEIDEMKESSKQIQTQVRSMLQGNLTLGTNIGAFGEHLNNLDEHKAALQTEVDSFEAEVNVDMVKLVNQIELISASTRDLLTAVGTKANTIQGQFHHMTAQAEALQAELNASNLAVAASREDLNKAIATISGQAKTFGDRQGELVEEDHALEAKRRNILESELKLQQRFDQVTGETTKLTKTKKEVESLIRQQMSVEESYKNRLLALSNEIKAKEALLKSLKTEIATSTQK